MKKILAISFLIVFAIFNTFAANTKKTKSNTGSGIELGIGSGYIFYGDSETKDLISSMNSKDFNRIILGSDLGFFIPLADIVLFKTNAELMTDMFWKGSEKCFLFDYAFNTGLKVYTNLGGLNFSVLYSLGRRTSYADLENFNDTSSTKWGNGFKFSMDYDIKRDKSGICPVIGTYWRHMPRGNSFSDNTISIYFKLLFK